MNKTGTLWSRDYIFLMIANFFLFFGDNLLLPVIPVYIKQNGAYNFQIGIVTAVFFATSILMRMFTGRASARLGKKALLILAVSVFALVMLGYYLFAGLIMILVLRLVQGLSFGASTTLYGSTAADIIPYERMGEGIGYFGLGMTIAAALGPFLGAAAVSLTNYKWVFLVAALLVMITIPLSFFIKADNHRIPVKKKVDIKDFLSDFIEPTAFYPSVFILLIGLSMGGIYTYVVLFGKEMSINNISVYFLVLSSMEFLVRMFCGKLYDKKGLNYIVVPGAIAGVIGCVVIANAANLAMVSISAAFCGIAFGMIFPAMQASAMKSAKPERRVAANATIYNFLDIGMALGPLLFGAVAQLSGYADTFMLSSSVFVVMLVILAAAAIIKRKKKVASQN
ncbi:MAG: MFS transporter [Clostridiaceae bacterium]|nr:MFS transporter [Clostridiaceae bacterium]